MTAVEAGADAIGLVFYAPSPRAVSIEQAEAVLSQLPPFVTTVGLFVDAAPGDVEAVLERVPLDLLQFHGQESPDDCIRFGRPYIKAVRMRPGTDLIELQAVYHTAAGLLLDAYQPGVPGGTGETFDWERIPKQMGRRIVLAGGLTPGNVERAIRTVQPYAVDVSGGVEQDKGVKDPAKIEAFMRGVECANR